MLKPAILRDKPPFSLNLIENLLLVVLTATLAGLALLQANPSTNLPSRDGGVFEYVGAEILRGKVPYIDVWDHKPPGIHYLNALALFITRGNRWGIWIFEFIFLFITILLIYKSLNRLWGHFSAWFGILLFLFGFASTVYNGNFTEEYSLLFNFLALFLFLQSLGRPNDFWLYIFIGITAGLSFLFRANNTGVQITIGLTILIMGVWKRNYAISIKRLILLLAGMLLPISGVIIFYAWKKALPLLLNAVITYNFSYSGSHIDPFSTLGHGFVILNIVALIALAGYIKVIQEILQRGKASLNERHFILLLGWPVEILLSSLSGRAYNHYFLCWLPMMALLTAYFFFAFGKRVERILTSQPLWLTYVIFLILLVVPSWRGFSIYKNALADVIAGRSPAVAIDPVSTYLHDHSSSNEKAFVWCGQGGIYFMSGREASTAYFLYPMFVNSALGISLENQFLADLQTHPPALIADVYYLVGGNEVCYSLDPAIREKQMTTVGKKQIIYTAHNIEQVYEFIEQNYHLETKISQAGIYRLNQTLTEGIGVSVLH